MLLSMNIGIYWLLLSKILFFKLPISWFLTNKYPVVMDAKAILKSIISIRGVCSIHFKKDIAPEKDPAQASIHKILTKLLCTLSPKIDIGYRNIFLP